MTAVQECLRLGYRRPGLVLLRRHNVSLGHRWEAGYLAGIADLPAGRGWPPGSAPNGPPRQLRQWLDSRRADVLITPDHETLAQALALAGRRIPADVGLSNT